MTTNREPKNGSPDCGEAPRERPAPQIGQKKVTEFEILGGKNPAVRRIRVTDQSNFRPHQRHNRPRKRQSFVVANNGKVSLAREESQIAESDPGLLEIIKLLSDKNASLIGILQLIESQMAKLVMKMKHQHVEPGPNPEAKLKLITSEWKSVQALFQSVERLPRHTQRDECDIDGPAFQLAVKRVRTWLEQALRDALGKESEGKARQIVERWDRLWEENREELRRTLNSMGEDSELPPNPEVNGANT